MSRFRIASHRDDRGIGMVEILLSFVILVMVSTATLAMFAVGMQSAVVSKSKDVASQAADTYMDRVRAMGYSDVGVIGGVPAGTLDPSETQQADGVRITLVPTVTWVDDPRIAGTTDYKRVRLAVTAYRQDDSVLTSTSRETFIRQEDNLPGDRQPPVIDWGTLSLVDGSIVWGTAVPVDATASTPMDSTKLVRLTFYCDSAPLRNAGGGIADWTLSSRSVSQSFYWDTTRLNEDGNKFSPDGTRVVKIVVADSLGQQDYKSRKYTVDNAAPAAPATLTLSTVASGTVSTLKAAWPLSYDGTDPATGYRMEFWKENRTDQNWSIPYTTGVLNSSTTSFNWAGAVPFGRYWGQVWALSPRGLTSGYRNPGNVAIVMPPQVTGTYTLSSAGNGGSEKYFTTAVSLAAPTAPQFTTSGNVTYDLFRSNDPNNMGATPWKTSTTPLAYTDSNTTAKNVNPVDWVYQYRVTFKPAGWPSYALNATQVIWSNKLHTTAGTTTGGPWALTVP